MNLIKATIPFAAFLLVGCGGLSEDAKRAAKTYADTLCDPATNELMGSEFTQLMVRAADIHAFTNKGEDGQTLKLANQMARDRGCIK